MAKRKLNQRQLFLLAFILLAGSAGCAKEGMPPGGPVDEDAPLVVEVYPEPGSINVNRGESIVFRFSESMDHRSTERALFFTPDIGPSLRVEWRGKELRLIPDELLRENTTIVITLGADATDMQRNRLGQVTTLAFSTGPVLDQALIGGSVVENGRFVSGAWIWIYPVGNDPEINSRANPALISQPDRTIPLYITQTDDSGRFEQTNMSEGRYRVFAFRDSDRNGIYDLDSDPLAVPPFEVWCEEDELPVKGLMLNIAFRDTTGPALRSASAPNSDFVNLRFTEPPADGILPVVTFEPYTDEGSVTDSTNTVNVIGGYFSLSSPATLTLRVEGLQPGVRYQANLLEVYDAKGNPGRTASRPITFSAPTQPDTTRPVVIETTPADSSLSLNQGAIIRLTFSTEIDTDSLEPWILTGQDTIGLESNWLDARNVELVVLDPVIPDALFDLVIKGESLKSWTGLSGPPEDYSATWRSIRPVGKGTLRFRVEGRPLPPQGRYRIIVEGMDSGTTPMTELELAAPGELSTPDLPVGPYWVWGYADTDGDGVMDIGSLSPFSPAEEVGVISDTLYVINTFESVYDIPLILGTVDQAGQGSGGLQ